MEGINTLKVYMLGGFEMYYDGIPLQFGKKLTAKPLQLLQLLLYHGEDGVSREKVIEALYGQRAEIDAANNLNATVSQLRKLLRETHLPDGNYIHIRLNRYFFEAPMETWLDVETVKELRKEADLLSGDERYECLSRICELFRGRLLPELDGEPWVEIAKADYQRLYRDSLTELCRMLREKEDYNEILRLSSLAAKLFPLDEWQVWQQEALLALGKVKEAQELYLQVEKLYMEALSAPPPEAMQQRYKKPDRKFWRRTESAENVRKWLSEENVGEANSIPLPAFMVVYNLVSKMSNADNPFCLLICTLNEKNSHSAPNEERFSALMDSVSNIFTKSLRLEDVFTRYSRNQYLVLLTGAREENLELITKRISDNAAPELSGTGCELEFQLVSANEVLPMPSAAE